MKIFINIASYRDWQLKNTIESLINNSSGQHDLSIGVFEQTVKENSLEEKGGELLLDNRIKYKRIDPQYSHGVCWARAINFMQLQDEDFIYEVDSHMVFDLNWDIKLIEDYNKGKELSGHDRVIITGSCKNYELGENNAIILHEHPVPMQSDVKYFIYQKQFNLLGAHGDIAPSVGTVTPAIHICAGNFFTKASWVSEVGANPSLFFEGEEQYMVLESVRKGYDLYHMSDIISYHYINTNEYETKQWYNPIITIERYSELTHTGYTNFNKYLSSLSKEFLQEFYDKTGVNYITKSLDERAKTYSILIPDEVLEYEKQFD